MVIDTTDALPPEQTEGPPVGENAEQIIDSTRLNLHVAKLAEQKPEVEKVCTNSEIKEERTFSKEDILNLIARFAMANKLELNDLKVSNIIRNDQGVILVLEVKSPGADGGYQLFNYTIKGRHEGNQCGTSNLDRSFWDKDDMPEGGNTIADYLEGKWRFIS